MRLFKLMGTAYENFDNTVHTYITKVFSSLGINNTNSQIFTLIFNAIKGIMQNAMFYIEDALTEQNIFTATRKKSIFNLAKISGYEPFFGSAANGTLTAKIKRGSILDNDTTKLFIHNHTKIINKKTNIIYNLILSSDDLVIDLSKPLTLHEFKIVEGSFNINYFFAKGDDFESFSIDTNKLYDRSYISIKVNGEKYMILNCIYDMVEGEKQCVLTAGYDNTFSIIFGNGIYGKKLNEGDNITVEWLSHSGKKGNVLSSDKNEFAFYTTGSDILGNKINLNNFIILNMSNCISGGIEADDINTIKQMIGYNSRSLVLASEDNFILFFKRFSFIGKIRCFMGSDSLNVYIAALSDAITKYTTPETYFKLPKDSLYLTTDQENQIIQSINNANNLYAGVSIKFIKPFIRRYAIICLIKEDDAYNREYIKELIRNILADYFINLPDKTEIIYKSDLIYTILNNCEHIKSLDLNIISELGEETYKNTYYEKLELTNKGGNYKFITTKIFYEKNNIPGLDQYGNIVIDSTLEMPLLQGGFHYYPNKEDNDRNTAISIDTIQYYFI